MQPGVYFALDAPFVRIIGLFSNALEDPGLISGENGKWPGVPDFQLSFLNAQLSRIKKEKYAGAVILATHHPPFSYSPKTKVGGGNHSSSADMLFEIDSVCKQAGVYPHAFLSGHAHNYQRFARKLTFGGKSIEVPFIISGDGGHNVNALVRSHKGQPVQEPPFGLPVDYLERSKTAVSTQGLTLKHYDDHNYGYLRVAVDKQHLRIGFQQVGKPLMQSRTDFVTVDLATHAVVGN